MTLAICLVAITPLQCSCLHSTHTCTCTRTHSMSLSLCCSPRAVLVTAQLYCITLTWQQKKTLCIGPAVYRRGTDPRINYARDRRRAHTHTHTHRVRRFLLWVVTFFVCLSKQWQRDRQKQQDTPDTLMLLCMLEAYSNRAELWL